MWDYDMKGNFYLRQIKLNPDNKHIFIGWCISDAIQEATEIFNGSNVEIKINKLINQTDKLCDVSFEDYYHLENGWFRKILAQSIDNPNESIVRLWDSMGWDFSEDSNPRAKKENTTIVISLKDKQGKLYDFKLTLVPKGNKYPPGADIMNVKSNIVWTILDSKFVNNYIEVEMESETVKSRKFKSTQLESKNWKRL